MYLRTTQRRKKDGSAVRYLQLAHNEWDTEAGYSKVRVLYNFGREDGLDRAAVERLIRSLTRVLEPARALAATAAPELSLPRLAPARWRLPARRALEEARDRRQPGGAARRPAARPARRAGAVRPRL
jgi:hypothetical protein